MKIVFLGVGEACDENTPNTAVWIQTEAEDGEPRSLLFDCGPTVTPLFFKETNDPENLDALWISHFHADHFFGAPTLLLRFWEMKRRRALTIIGQTGVHKVLNEVMELAYPGFLAKLTYPLIFEEVEPHREALRLLGLSWRFAQNGHGQRDLAVRLEDGKNSIFYSGDGSPTEETLALADSCSLIIHEAFDLEDSMPGHGTIQKCVDFARKAKASSLALVHIQRDVRKNRYEEILNVINKVDDFHVLLPDTGDRLDL